MRDLEAARYAVDRAFRQYDAADPSNRLVTAEREARWNAALARQAEVEAKITAHDTATASSRQATPVSFASLAEDIETVWHAPTTDTRLKKRIVRTLIREVIADIDTEAAEGSGQVVLLVHWMGGVHTELRLPRRRRGQRNSTSTEAIEAIRQLVLVATDDVIAAVLNRNGLRTGKGNRWTRERICSLRSYRKIPAFRPTPDGSASWLNLTRAAALLGTAPKTLRLAAIAREIEALHPLPDGPWLFRRTDIEGSPGQNIRARARNGRKQPAGPMPGQQNLFISAT